MQNNSVAKTGNMRPFKPVLLRKDMDPLHRRILHISETAEEIAKPLILRNKATSRERARPTWSAVSIVPEVVD